MGRQNILLSGYLDLDKMTENISGLQKIINPWYNSLNDPAETQNQLLLDLLKGYCNTRYGSALHADDIEDIAGFRKSFPLLDYKLLNPYLSDVTKGDYGSILPEPVVSWVMTRGSTGRAKVLPITRTHLEQIFSCGARALINYVIRKKDIDILSGKVLNFNLPSNVHTLNTDGQDLPYGYSSGT
jgi:hypothetical protein